MGGSGLVLTFDYGNFSEFLTSGLVDVFFPRGFGQSRLIHFLFDASESLGWIVASARSYAHLHDVTSAKGLQVNLEHGWQFQHCFHTEQS